VTKTKQHYDPVTPAQVTMQPHYASLSPQPRTVAMLWGLMGDAERYCALKYLARADLKGAFDDDIAKAADWLLWRLLRAQRADLLRDLSKAASRYADMATPSTESNNIEL
jgi:hypothetical protein